MVSHLRKVETFSTQMIDSLWNEGGDDEGKITFQLDYSRTILGEILYGKIHQAHSIEPTADPVKWNQ